MKYDFTTCIDRTSQGSKKWLLMREAKEDIQEGITPLSVADLDFPMPPAVVEGLKKDLDSFICGYTLPTDAYFQAVQKWMRDQHHWEVERDWLVTTPGVVPAINVFVNAFTEPGDGVIIFQPVYGPFADQVVNHQRDLTVVELINQEGSYTINFEAFKEAAKDPHNKAVIFCSPHNPCGRIWTPKELEEVAAICMEHDLYLFSDEIHFDLAHKEYTHHVFASLSPEIAQHVIVATAPSKTFNLAGLQTSNIFIPNSEWRERYTLMAEKLNLLGSPALGLLACQHAYNTSADWKDELVEVIEHNMHSARQTIQEKLPKAVVTPAQASYLLWVDLRQYNLKSDDIMELMLENDLFVTDGRAFGQAGDGFIRIHLALPTKIAEAAIDRLCQALKDY